MSIRAVVLDIDGTLMDTNYLHVEAFARAFAEAGHPVPRTSIHRQIGKGSDQLLPELVRNDEIVAAVDRRHGEIYRELQQHGYPLPGARELLASVAERGYEVWLATSAKPEELEYHLGSLEAKGRVTGIVSSGDVEDSKPEPDIFQRVLAQCSYPPDQVIVVGDTVWDVEAAARAGLRTVAVLTGGAFSRDELLAAGAVAVVQDCAELLQAGFPQDF